jgi:hypothetical protein
MQYISVLREIWMLVVTVGEVEGCERKYEPKILHKKSGHALC